MERVNGIEPSYAAWEAAVLPLNYTREVGDFTWVVRNTQLNSSSSAMLRNWRAVDCDLNSKHSIIITNHYA